MLTQLLRIRTVGIALAILFSAQLAWAQGYGMPSTRGGRGGNSNSPNAAMGRAQNMQTPFQGTATINSVGGRGLAVTDANGNNWLVAPDKTCKIQVTGSADPDFLKSPAATGLLVRFNAEVDKKKGNKTTSPVNELEIVSPQTAMAADKEAMKGGDDEDKKSAKGGLGPNTVIGHIKEFKNNQLTVESPGGPVVAEIGSNPAIKINTNDFRFAQPGDKVDVRGYYIKLGDAVAQEMRVTMSNPLGADPKKKPAAKSSTTTASK